MRRRPWRALIVLGIVIVCLLMAADVLARTVAERKLAERVAERVPTAESTSARIRSFLFLPRLAVTGRVAEVDAAVAGIEVHGLRFATISVQLDGVELDRTELAQHGRVVIDRIRRGDVRAVITEDDLGRLIGIPIHLESGHASVTVFGAEVGADLAVEDGRLVIGGIGISIPGLDLVAPLLPCVPDLEIEPGQIVLTCEFTEIPAELVA